MSLKLTDFFRSTTGQLVDIAQGVLGKKGTAKAFDYNPKTDKGALVRRKGNTLEVARIKHDASDATKMQLRRMTYIGAESMLEKDDTTLEQVKDDSQRAIASVLDSGRLRNVLSDKYLGDRLLFSTEAEDAVPQLQEASAAEALTNLLALNRSLSLSHTDSAALAQLMASREDLCELWGKLQDAGLTERALRMRTKQEAVDLSADLLQFFKDNDVEPPPSEGDGAGSGDEGDDGKGEESGERGDQAAYGKDGASYENIGGVLKNELHDDGTFRDDITSSSFEAENIKYIDRSSGTSGGYGDYAANITKMVDDNDRIGHELARLLQVRSAARYEHNLPSGKVSPSNLYRVALPTMGSGKWNAAVFRKRKQSDCLDTAVELVVDCSGSMSGDKYTAAAAAAVIMGNALSVVRVPFEVIGFTDDYGTAHIPVFKTFDSSWVASEVVKGFDEQGYYLNGNPDAVAVQVAASRLHQRKNKRRVMIVLSDGHPASFLADGHGALLSAVHAAEAGGIEVFGIGIDSTAVKAFYKHNQVIHDYSQLTSTLLAVLDKHLS